MRETDLVQALIEAISSEDEDAAERAAQGCAERTDLLPALRPLLTDINENRRWWATRVLALIGGPAAASLAIHQLADPDEATRCAAALALGQMRAAPGTGALGKLLADDSGWVRDTASDALAQIGEAALPVLVAALADNRQPVRVRAAAALRKVVGAHLAGLTIDHYPPAFSAPLNALYRALNDPNRLVRQYAFEALDRLGLFDQVYFAP